MNTVLNYLGMPHPERRNGETFLCYTNEGSYGEIGRTTKRRGRFVLEEGGQLTCIDFEEIFPVFVQTAELVNDPRYCKAT